MGGQGYFVTEGARDLVFVGADMGNVAVTEIPLNDDAGKHGDQEYDRKGIHLYLYYLYPILVKFMLIAALKNDDLSLYR